MGAASQWPHGEWVSKEANHIKDPLEDSYQSEDEGTCYCSPVRDHSKENVCRAWHASLENCSLLISLEESLHLSPALDRRVHLPVAPYDAQEVNVFKISFD